MNKSFEELYNIMSRLRKECPWDKAQTSDSLVNHTIEEVYELAESIYKKDCQEKKEELGDIFMHLIFYVILAEEKQEFNLDDVLKGINKKLIFRHPHIFEDAKKLNTADEVLETWQKRKKLEGKEFTFSGVAKNMPSIPKAKRIQEKSRSVGFDWENKEDVFEKIKEEFNELQEAVRDNSNIEEEFGDMLFAMINYSRFLNIDAEKSLQMASHKFINRFTEMEKIAQKKNVSFIDLSIDDKNNLWEEVKKNEKLN